MSIKPAALLAAVALATLLPTAARAAFPEKVFAPYMYIGAGDNFKLTDCDDATGLKFYTLAFIIAKQEGWKKDVVYHKQPSWDGNSLMTDHLYAEQIDAIRQRGGDVIMSFGGEAGKEMANIIDNEADLEAAYQSVIDAYKFTWLDFDVEGNNLDKGKADSERRNTVLASLQKKNPGLIISYTLPVDPHGLSEESLALLSDAVKKGVKVHSANIMVMYFGKEFIHKGKSEGELGVDSANTAHDQLQKIDPTIQVGLCPCIGENGSKEEIFTPDDAVTLKAFADKTPWVCSLHFWSINDDAALPKKHKKPTTQPAAPTPPAQPWAFAKIFQPFTK